MRAIIRTTIHVALLALCASAFAQTPRAPGLRDVVDPSAAAPVPPPSNPGEAAPPPPKPQPDPMTLLFKRVSQLMMVTFEGVNRPTDADRQLLKTLPPGAIVLPRITDPESVASYVNALRPLAAGAFEELPFMIGVDLFAQERYADQARVSTVLRVPTMLSLAAAGPSEASAAVFRMLADHLHSMGFDFHVGPSLALAPAEGLGVGSLYSFGSDPAVGSALGRQFGDALHAQGIAWMPVGYPGGAGSPPVLLTPRSQLRNRDLLPYAGAVAGGLRLINVGPSLVPTLDDATPACFSAIVIRDLRNDALGFKGLVVSGPIDAPDIRDSRRLESAAVEALLAGADMLYWNSSGAHVAKAVAAIVDGVQRGTIDDALIERALNHVREFKNAQTPPQAEKEVLGGSKKLAAKQEKFPEPAALERRAITLVRNESATLPLTPEASQPIAVVAVYGAEELQHALEGYIKPIAHRPLPAAKQAARIQDFELNRIVKISASYRTIVYVVSNDIELAGQRRLIRTFKGQGKRVVAVVLGYPKNLPALLDADAIVLTYGSTKRVADSMNAVADVLAGNAPIEILPPLRPLALHAGELTTFDVNDVLRSPVGRLPVAFDPPFVAGYSVSYRPTAALESVRWEFGDGAKSSAPSATHAYEKPGEYLVKLTVGGRKTESVTGTFQVRVQ
jgi:beta-N-acetylhexosaminidase